MSENPAGGVPEAVRTTDGWQSVIDDMAATAEAFRDRGWTTLELHPGDAVLVDTESRTGLDVLLPGSEFEDLEDLVSDHAFTEVEVFGAQSGGIQYLLIVETDPSAQAAVFVPAYYEPGRSRSALEAIRGDGELRVFCRRLNNDYVTFRHDDISPFLPDR